MPELIPLYFATLDGEDPCSWSPFGTSMKSLADGKKEIMGSHYSSAKQFSVSILCRKHERLADEAISQTIGCLIDAKYLKPESRRYIDAQFVDFSRRLVDMDKGVIGILGFEIYFVTSKEAPDCDLDQAMEFKNRLILAGFDDSRLRVDVICDQGRLTSLPKLRLVNIKHTQKAIKLPVLPPP
jgi:hypothetical protein